MKHKLKVTLSMARGSNNLTQQICWQANSSPNQFGGKISSFNLSSLAFKSQQKKFCYFIKANEKKTAIVQLIRAKIRN